MASSSLIRGSVAAIVALALGLLVGATALTAAAAQPPTIPAGATSPVTLPASHSLACTPPGEFHPNPTTWTINPPTVKVSNTTDGPPPAGHVVNVTVPAGHPPSQPITISWSGNTTCLTYNGSITINVGKALSASPGGFARAAVPLARGIIPLARDIKRQSKKPARLKPLLAKLRRRANEAAGSFNLAKLSKKGTWTPCRRRATARSATLLAGSAQSGGCGVKLRIGQLKAMPEFARDLNKINGYEKVMVQLLEEQYAADPGFRGNVDLQTGLQYPGRTYAQLEPAEKADIASQFPDQTGATAVLLRWAQNAAKSALGVVFGR